MRFTPMKRRKKSQTMCSLENISQGPQKSRWDLELQESLYKIIILPQGLLKMLKKKNFDFKKLRKGSSLKCNKV